MPAYRTAYYTKNSPQCNEFNKNTKANNIRVVKK